MTARLTLSDPRVRLVLGVAGLVGTAAVARRNHVGRREVAVFQAVNRQSDRLFAPTWLVMQSGTLGAAPVAAAAAYLAGRPALARRLVVSGAATWVLAKGVKRSVGRPRPRVLVPLARSRGREASGLGYVSGHAGITVALATAAYPHLGRAGRRAVVAVPPVVALARVYVGAHLPLDVVGGAALGLAVEATLALYDERLAGRVGRRAGVRPGPAPAPGR